MTLLRYLDVALLVVAAPIMLLIGVPASGYLIAAGVWIVLRAAGVAIDRMAAAGGPVSREVTLRLSYLMGRLFILAIVVILVRKDAGQNAGLTALFVFVFAFTLQLLLSVGNRPQRPAGKTSPATKTSSTRENDSSDPTPPRPES